MRVMHDILRVGAAMAAMIAMTASLAAAEVIGSADTVANRVTGEISSKKRILVDRDVVHRDEVVQTDRSASARIVFRDASDLRLGANARIKLSSSVYGGQQGATLELSRGALRFFSGNGPVGSYQVRTPVATIGLRGTGIGIVITATRTYVTLLNGAAQVCTRGGQCSLLAQRCSYVTVDRANVTQPQPVQAGVPSFASRCTGPACGEDVCGVSASPSPSPMGYDPAGGSSNGSGGSGGAGGKR
ncbi:MAG TPA: FecR domain-containing protein [Rhabdaerophilum sp.]|nr:FecR domain-containing protein [Rhabdaerophilum sp.]